MLVLAIWYVLPTNSYGYTEIGTQFKDGKNIAPNTL